MTGWWERLGELWQRRFRYRMTALGAAYIGALTLMTAAAFLSGNNLLFLVLAAMISLLLMSGFVGRLMLAGLELDVLLPAHTVATRPATAKVVVKNLKAWLPSFSVRLRFNAAPDDALGFRPLPEAALERAVYFPLIAGGGIAEHRVELLFPRRGSYRQRSFEFSTRFPFGFAERREMVTVRHEVIVYPRFDAQPGFETLLTQSLQAVGAQELGQGEDFYRIRPYEGHDSARHVDWKATAHVGALQVREFSRQKDQVVIIMLDLNAGQDAAAWFETAIECAAYLVFELVGCGVPVRFITQNADVTIAAPADIYNILKYLALVSRMQGPMQGPNGGKLQVVPDDNTFQFVLTYHPERLREQGWGAHALGRLLGPDAFDIARLGTR